MQNEKGPSTNGAETTLEKKIKRPNSKPIKAKRATLQCCEIERVRLTEAFFFSRDSLEIRAQLQKWDAEFLMGSSLEEGVASEKGIPFLAISYPAYHQTIANKSYAGVQGALRAAEDFLTAIKKTRKERAAAFLDGNGR